jgi:hypothetical protein
MVERRWSPRITAKPAMADTRMERAGRLANGTLHRLAIRIENGTKKRTAETDVYASS